MERLLATYRQAHERFPQAGAKVSQAPEQNNSISPQSEGREKASDVNSQSHRAELLGSERHFLMEATL